MNTISFKGRSQIAAVIQAMDDDPDIRVIVIRGANGLYSSGGDIAGFLKVERDGMHDLHWNVAAPERAKKPVIAAIEKWARGVSFELSLACDFRLATENSMLALPEINLGVTPGSGGTVRVAHLAGLTRAKEMIMRGRRITARGKRSSGALLPRLCQMERSIRRSTAGWPISRRVRKFRCLPSNAFLTRLTRRRLA